MGKPSHFLLWRTKEDGPIVLKCLRIALNCNSTNNRSSLLPLIPSLGFVPFTHNVQLPDILLSRSLGLCFISSFVFASSYLDFELSCTFLPTPLMQRIRPMVILLSFPLSPFWSISFPTFFWTENTNLQKSAIWIFHPLANHVLLSISELPTSWCFLYQVLEAFAQPPLSLLQQTLSFAWCLVLVQWALDWARFSRGWDQIEKLGFDREILLFISVHQRF